MERLELFGNLREVDSDAHRVTAVISTGDVARDGAIIDPAGWDFSNYDRNPVVLWMHDDRAMPFARTIERIATEKELIARAEFDMEDPMGAQVFRKIANGYINATSVRWLPKRTEQRTIGEGADKHEVLAFVEQELLEWSWVTIPSDPGALIMRADGTPFSIADYLAPTFLPDLHWLRELRLPPELPPNGHHAQPDTQKLERLLVRYFERRNQRLDVDEMVVSSLSRLTGKSEQRVRQEMAEGG